VPVVWRIRLCSSGEAIKMGSVVEVIFSENWEIYVAKYF
tara:strand:+ start:550 stop:666 length:117 start_codon:yes stop_codon:yes gene_type:complete